MSRRLDKKKQKRQITPSAPVQAAGTPAAAQSVPVQIPAQVPESTVIPEEKETVVHFYIQYQDQEYLESEILQKIEEQCLLEGIKVDDLDEISVYMKPEDRKAYYVCGDKSGSIDL